MIALRPKRPHVRGRSTPEVSLQVDIDKPVLQRDVPRLGVRLAPLQVIEIAAGRPRGERSLALRYWGEHKGRLGTLRARAIAGLDRWEQKVNTPAWTTVTIVSLTTPLSSSVSLAAIARGAGLIGVSAARRQTRSRDQSARSA